MSSPGPFGRRLLTGPHRGHLELCAETYGQPCDLECLDLDKLLADVLDLEADELEPVDLDLEWQTVAMRSVFGDPWNASAAVASAIVMFWTLVAALLWWWLS